MSITVYPVVKTTDASAINVAENFTTINISRTDGKKGKSGNCCVVPVVSDSVLVLVMQDKFGRAFLVDAIDGLRSKLASARNKDGLPITSDKIGIEALLAAMATEVTSATLSADSIGKWFDTYMAQVLMETFKARKPDAIAAQLDKLVGIYRSLFCSISGRNLIMEESQKVQLIKALDLLPEDGEVVQDALTDKIVAKIESLATITTDLL